jgi:hypothetical protein
MNKVRYFFWFILGCVSVFFAEVVSGSQIYPFFTLIDYILVLPLYTLHTLVLGYIVYRNTKPRLYTLFSAGALYGLYEAYITKVLWNPPWGTNTTMFLGVAVFETLLLVLFWHAFLAFIVPLFLVETTLTSSREVIHGLPVSLIRKIEYIQRKRLHIVLAFLAGLFQGGNSPSIQDSLLSGLSSGGFLIALILLWKRIGGINYSFRSLMPTEKEFKRLSLALLAYYILTTALLRPGELPGLVPQLVIWVLYVIFGGLLHRGLKKSRLDQPIGSDLDFSVNIVNMIVLTVVFSLGSILGVATGIGSVFMLIVWFVGTIIGLITLVYTVRSVFL